VKPIRPEQFLKEIAEYPDLILIVKKEGIISEARGKFTVEMGREWLTIKNEGCRCHIHMKPDECSHANFVRTKNNEGRDMFSIEMMGKDEKLILKASFPTKTAMEESRTAFEKMRERAGCIPKGGDTVTFSSKDEVSV